MAGIKRISRQAPSVVSLDQAKRQIRVLDNDSDSELQELILHATSRVENITGIPLSTCQYEQTFDRWSPFGDAMRLTKWPVQSLDSIQYIDTNGTTQTLATTQYKFSDYRRPARFYRAYSVAWPTVRDEVDSVLVTYTAGYANSGDAPEDIVKAILFLIGHWWQHREPELVGTISKSLPHALDDMLVDYSHFSQGEPC